MDPASPAFVVEGEPHDHLVDFLTSLGLRQADKNMVIYATLVVVSVTRPITESHVNIIDIALELEKRVIVIGRPPSWLFPPTLEVCATVQAFETLMRQEPRTSVSGHQTAELAVRA